MSDSRIGFSSKEVSIGGRSSFTASHPNASTCHSAQYWQLISPASSIFRRGALGVGLGRVLWVASGHLNHSSSHVDGGLHPSTPLSVVSEANKVVKRLLARMRELKEGL